MHAFVLLNPKWTIVHHWVKEAGDQLVLPRYIAKGDVSRLNVYIFSHIAK